MDFHCSIIRTKGLRAAFPVYEPTFPRLFEREYPGLVGVYHRPTQVGAQDMHSHVDPDNPKTWGLVASKYAELARDFPEMKLNRDWSAYLLVQYGIERGVYPADRLHLGRMSRYVEQFIVNLRDLRDTEASRRVMSRLAFPDRFPLS